MYKYMYVCTCALCVRACKDMFLCIYVCMFVYMHVLTECLTCILVFASDAFVAVLRLYSKPSF